MNFEHNDKTKELIARLKRLWTPIFIPPSVYAEQMEAFGENRWQVPAILEELKEKAKAEGLWNLFLPESERGYGLTMWNMPFVRNYGSRGLCRRSVQLLGPRHGQYGSAGALRQ